MGYISISPKSYTGGMIVPVGLVGRQTGTTAADSVIWAVRNTGTVTMYLRKLHLCATFDGTAAATTALYRIGRLAAATPSGGTAIVGILRHASMTLPTYDAREAVAGLTVTSVTYDTGAYTLSCQRQVSASTVLDVTDSLSIAAGYGLYIRLSAAAVVGDCLSGHVELDWL